MKEAQEFTRVNGVKSVTEKRGKMLAPFAVE